MLNLNVVDEISEFLQLQQWQRQNKGVALATVIQTWGSCPRPVGSHLAINEDGEFAGSVSGGCIEAAVITEALEVIRSGEPRRLDFDVADERAWEVGLSCGGEIHIIVALVDAEILARLLDDYRKRRSAALVSCFDTGRSCRLFSNSIEGSLVLTDAEIFRGRALLNDGHSQLFESAGVEYFLRSYIPNHRLIIIGAVHIAQILAPMASLAGYEVIVIDPRRAFATADRFPKVQIINEWPDEALEQMPLDAHSAVVTLSHDPKIDDPALQIALPSPAFYIGCLGSRRTHAKRLLRLQELGLSDQLERIHAPIGIKLSHRAQSPAEIAVSILAEIIAMRYGDGRENG